MTRAAAAAAAAAAASAAKQTSEVAAATTPGADAGAVTDEVAEVAESAAAATSPTSIIIEPGLDAGRVSGPAAVGCSAFPSQLSTAAAAAGVDSSAIPGLAGDLATSTSAVGSSADPTLSPAADAAASTGAETPITLSNAALGASNAAAAGSAAAIAAGPVGTTTSLPGTVVVGTASAPPVDHPSAAASNATSGARKRYRKILVPAPTLSQSAKDKVRVTRSMTRKRRLEPNKGSVYPSNGVDDDDSENGKDDDGDMRMVSGQPQTLPPTSAANSRASSRRPAKRAKAQHSTHAEERPAAAATASLGVRPSVAATAPLSFPNAMTTKTAGNANQASHADADAANAADVADADADVHVPPELLAACQRYERFLRKRLCERPPMYVKLCQAAMAHAKAVLGHKILPVEGDPRIAPDPEEHDGFDMFVFVAAYEAAARDAEEFLGEGRAAIEAAVAPAAEARAAAKRAKKAARAALAAAATADFVASMCAGPGYKTRKMRRTATRKRAREEAPPDEEADGAAEQQQQRPRPIKIRRLVDMVKLAEAMNRIPVSNTIDLTAADDATGSNAASGEAHLADESIEDAPAHETTAAAEGTMTPAMTTTTDPDAEYDSDLSSVMGEESLHALEEKVAAAPQLAEAMNCIRASDTVALIATEDATGSNAASGEAHSAGESIDAAPAHETIAVARETLAPMTTTTSTTTTEPEDEHDSDLSSVMGEDSLHALEEKFGTAQLAGAMNYKPTSNTIAAEDATRSNAASGEAHLANESTKAAPAHETMTPAARKTLTPTTPLRTTTMTTERDNGYDSDLSSVMGDEPLRVLEQKVGAARWKRAAARRSALRKPGQAKRVRGAHVMFSSPLVSGSARAPCDVSPRLAYSSGGGGSGVGDDDPFLSPRRTSDGVSSSSPGAAGGGDTGGHATAALLQTAAQTPDRRTITAATGVRFTDPLVAGVAANPFSQAELGIRVVCDLAAMKANEAQIRDDLRRLRASDEAAWWEDE